MCDFFVYISGAPEESFLITVPCNYGLLEKLLNDLRTKFMRAILPEMVSRGSEKNDRRIYCICRRQSFGKMIVCSNPHCKIEWFHYPCI